MELAASRLGLWVIVLLLVGSLASCSSGVTTTSGQTAPDEQPAGTSVEVTRADFGRDWPLTVDSGVLSCEGAGAVYFTSGGTRYALNGLAQGQGDAPEVDPIWADNPSGFAPKKNIGPLIDRGLQLCDED